MISIPSVMVAMYCFNQGKKLFLVTFHVDRKGLSVERCIIIIIIIIIISNKKPYLNETISTSISSEFPEYTFRICKGKKIGVLKVASTLEDSLTSIYSNKRPASN